MSPANVLIIIQVFRSSLSLHQFEANNSDINANSNQFREEGCQVVSERGTPVEDQVGLVVALVRYYKNVHIEEQAVHR